MASPRGYSTAQIGLHWVIAVLIVFQLIFGEDMGSAWRSFAKGEEVVLGTSAWAHILAGIAVLVLVVWRLGLRWTRGVPDAPAGTSERSALAADLGHKILYALMVLAPVSGLLAWYGGITALAEVHEWFKPAFFVFIAIHVLAALWHHFGLKDGLLDRMRKAQD